MAWKCEVFIKRTQSWLTIDEHQDTIGERALSRKAYDKYLRQNYSGWLHIHPEYRISEFAAPRVEPGVPLKIDGIKKLGRALARL